MLAGERNQGQMPGALDRNGHVPLVLGAQAALATRENFPTVADKTAQIFHPFPIDDLGFIRAKETYSAPRLKTHRTPGGAIIALVAVSLPRPPILAVGSIPVLSPGRRCSLNLAGLLSLISFDRLLSHNNLPIFLYLLMWFK
jgi:hypothetical protein